MIISFKRILFLFLLTFSVVVMYWLILTNERAIMEDRTASLPTSVVGHDVAYSGPQHPRNILNVPLADNHLDRVEDAIDSTTSFTNTTIRVLGRTVDDTATSFQELALAPSNRQVHAESVKVSSRIPADKNPRVVIMHKDQLHTQSQKLTPTQHHLQTNRALSTNGVPESHLKMSDPLHSSQPCSQPYCLNYLEETDQAIYYKCVHKITAMLRIPEQQLGCKCTFRDSSKSRLVALVSLPGSGNTWVRGLLQKVTGLCTGSIYCDKSLRAEGFCGEGIRSSVSIVVKTHDTILQWAGVKYRTLINKPVYDAAIFVVRDPYRAAVAEWNREKSRKFAANQTGSMHVKYINYPELFGSNPQWNKFALGQIRKWKVMIANYIIKNRHPMLTVFFEDLKVDTMREVKRMLDFLEYPYSDEELQATLLDGFNQFYRNHTDTFDHFTSNQTASYNSVITDIAKRLKQYNLAQVALKLEQYVRI